MSVHGRNWSASWPDVVPLADASLEMPLPRPVPDVCLLGLFGGLGSDIWECWLSIKHIFHGGVRFRCPCKLPPFVSPLSSQNTAGHPNRNRSSDGREAFFFLFFAPPLPCGATWA